MRTKKKLSVTLDIKTLESIDEAAISFNMAKSRLAQEAFSLWFKKRTEEMMAAGYADMAEEDREFAEMAVGAQNEVV
jgi:hypothetical protein